MTNVTDYQVILDSSVTLPKSNGDIDEDSKFPATGLGNGRTVLFMQVNPSGTAELKVTLNGADVQTVTFGTDPTRSWHEIIDEGVLKDSGNVLTLTRNSGSGSLTVSGVFVPYQHEI